MPKLAKLFLIDFQNDFVLEDAPLKVLGSQEDVDKIADFIHDNGAYISDILLTVDTHSKEHISHRGFPWFKKDGSPVEPFTLITPKAYQNGDFYAGPNRSPEYIMKYLDSIGPFMVWPDHCIDQTPGQAICRNILYPTLDWAKGSNKTPTIIKKGFVDETENFSIFAASFPYNEASQFNYHLFEDLVRGDDYIFIAGEAADYCVYESVLHLVEKALERGVDMNRIVLLTDAMSSVDPLNGRKEEMIEFVKENGGQTLTVKEAEVLLA